MQTNFTAEQLRDPRTSHSNDILRTCVHCGFCTATCPTYQVLGDELDSPRGRIYLIKSMLEEGRPADKQTVKHIDRCLSCLACMTTCPSSVNYMHLVDHAREYIEQTYRRPLGDRLLRRLLRSLLPYPARFRVALYAAVVARPFRPLIPIARLRSMFDLVPPKIPRPNQNDRPQTFAAEGPAKWRVALLTGCAQRALNPDINNATIRILRRFGCDVVVAKGAGCCGALAHHMGCSTDSHAAAARNISAWTNEVEVGRLDAIIINTSGCGTTVKDYWHMFKGAPMEGAARKVSQLAKDISEFLVEIGFPECPRKGIVVAYHAACSLQHGQKIRSEPKSLLATAGFEVLEPADSHICCGSAGTYNLLQPEIAKRLQSRKVESLDRIRPDVIAAGNLGCMMQIGPASNAPVVHTVELLDWSTGGPKPPALHGEIAAD